MAHLSKDNLPILGSIHDLVIYKMRGTDKIVVRQKGEISKKRYKTGSEFENPRRNNAEFGGRARMMRCITPILRPLSHITDYSWSAALNKMLKPAQLLDTVSPWGERNISLSLNPHLLEGFNLNSKYLLESVIRQGLTCTISRDTMSARIQVPTLVPSKNFFMPKNYDWYQVTAVLGIIPDHLYAKDGYQPVKGFGKFHSVNDKTDWFPRKKGSAAVELSLSLPAVSNSSFSLIVLAGVSFGKVADVDYIEAENYVGAAKIVGMG